MSGGDISVGGGVGAASSAASSAAAAAGATATREANYERTQKKRKGKARAPAPSLLKETVGGSSSPPRLVAPKVDLSQLLELMRAAQIDQMDTELVAGKEDAEETNDRMQSSSKANIESMKKAESARHKRGLAGLLMKIFGWIASVVAVAVSVVVAVVSFGSGTPLVALAAAASVALTVGLTVASATGGMDKMTDALASSLANSIKSIAGDKAKLIGQIMAQVIIAAIVMTTQLALAVLSGGGQAAATISAKILKLATNIAMKGGYVVSATAAGAMGASGAAAGVYGYTEGVSRSNIKAEMALRMKLEAIMESNQDVLEELVQKLEAAREGMSSMVKDGHETSESVMRNLSMSGV